MKNKKELNEKVPVRKKGLYEKYVKRPQDFCCALLAIVVLSGYANYSFIGSNEFRITCVV